jgi:predicted ATP-grasp superfamily ATP-dependent carboligase
MLNKPVASMKRIFVHEYLSGGGLIPSADDAEVNDEVAAAELLPLGLSMRDALVQDLLQVDGVALSVGASLRAPSVPDPAEPVWPRDGESAIDFVARQAAQHDLAWIVAPETGGLLARMHQVVGPSRWLGCSAAAIALTSSKRATLQRLSEHGVASPLAFAHMPDMHRWVVKPDDGAGGVATRVHRAHEEAVSDWAQRSTPNSPMVLEPWVEGEALSLSMLCTAQGAEMLSVNRQCIAIDAAGTLSFEGVVVNTVVVDSTRGRALSLLAVQVANCIAGLRGFVGIDLVWHPRCGPVVIEVNPRVTCAYVGLSAALGRNLAEALLMAHVGDHAESCLV